MLDGIKGVLIVSGIIFLSILFIIWFAIVKRIDFDQNSLRTLTRPISILAIFAVGFVLVVAGVAIPNPTQPIPPDLVPQSRPTDEFDLNMKKQDEDDTQIYISYEATINIARQEDTLYVALVRDATGATYPQTGFGILSPDDNSFRSGFVVSKIKGQGSYPMYAYIQLFDISGVQKKDIPTSVEALTQLIGELNALERTQECVVDVAPASIVCG